MAITVLRPQRTIHSYNFDLGYTATGKQSERHKQSRIPIDTISQDGLSEPAKLLMRAAEGDYKSYLKLSELVQEHVDEHGKINHWKIAGKECVFSTLAVDSELYPRELDTHKKLADRLGVSQQAYTKNWSSKMTIVKSWFRGWWGEINNCK